MEVTWKWIAYEMFINSGLEYLTQVLFAIYILYRVYKDRELKQQMDRLEQKIGEIK